MNYLPVVQSLSHHILQVFLERLLRVHREIQVLWEELVFSQDKQSLPLCAGTTNLVDKLVMGAGHTLPAGIAKAPVIGAVGSYIYGHAIGDIISTVGAVSVGEASPSLLEVRNGGDDLLNRRAITVAGWLEVGAASRCNGQSANYIEAGVAHGIRLE